MKSKYLGIDITGYGDVEEVQASTAKAAGFLNVTI